MSWPRMYVLAAHLLNGRTGEHRFLTSAEVVAGEEEAVVRAALLAQPENGHAEDWDVLSVRCWRCFEITPSAPSTVSKLPP